MAIDPICGMEVDESSEIRVERDGEVFYFCCEHCRQRFLNPARSVVQIEGLGDSSEPSCCRDGQGAASPRVITSDQMGKYICPMCPGVESDVPASCPVCGMALERAEISLDVDASSDLELLEMTRRLKIAAVLTVPLMLLAMLPMLGVDLAISPALARWMQLALAVPVVIWAGQPFFVRGVRSLISRHLNMFTLISLGVGAAFLYSLVAMLFPGLIPDAFKHDGDVAVYFEAASMIIVLVLLGQVLELRARQRTGSALRELLSLAPPKARRIDDSGETEISLGEVQRGDHLKVVPGDTIPVDGVVVGGTSAVNEAMITGESLPVTKRVGDLVIGGTINQSGALEMRADRVGNDTMLAQIVRMVADAQRSRAPIQRVADAVAGWFVPSVVFAAVVTFVAWGVWSPVEPRLAFALVCSVSVLIIACPCALGLATPMSIMVGIGRGAKEGILIHDAEILESLESVDTIVIDKTGTLTEGRPTVVACEVIEPFQESELLTTAAAVEANSEHPFGRAIVEAASKRGYGQLPVDEFQSMTGAGVTGLVAGRRVDIGNSGYMRELHVELPEDRRWATDANRDAGHSAILVAIDGQLAGWIMVADAIKATSVEAVRQLHAMNRQIVMLTGDEERSAQSIAAQLKIDRVYAGMTPADKLRLIDRLKSAGHRVAMAGDGINDAPALAKADVGIAMGTGTDVAMQTAGVTLVKGDLLGIAKAIRLSQHTMRNIRQNLWFAFCYNAAGVPIAAGILVPLFGLHAMLNPMVAAAAMSLSSVSVIGNALRLQRVSLAGGA